MEDDRIRILLADIQKYLEETLRNLARISDLQEGLQRYILEDAEEED